MSPLPEDPSLAWFDAADVRPFVFERPDFPWARPEPHPWFEALPFVKNSFGSADVPFTEMILKLDAAAYAASGMAMPRWVFYDCGLLPGLVAGFARRRDRCSSKLQQVLTPEADADWLPISLYIMIPGRGPGEWIAHNLCTANAVSGPDEAIHGLGFLTKAFGLWWAGARTLCGVTQWGSPALRLHAHFGPIEILTAYTPVHSHPATLTYRVGVDSRFWPRFFAPADTSNDEGALDDAGFEVDPKCANSLKSFQRRLEASDARYYLSATQIKARSPDDALTVYKSGSREG